MNEKQAIELSDQGRKLLVLLVSEIQIRRFDMDRLETLIGYGEVLERLHLPPDARHGKTDGQTLQFNGLNDLARWIHQHPQRLPRITGLIVSHQPYDDIDGTRRPPHVPGKGYFVEYRKNTEDWTWWLAESRKAVDFNWLPYLPIVETFDFEAIRFVGSVSEGALREVPTKVRKRSEKLRDIAREHFSRDSPDGKLHCAACDWSKPTFPLAYEIVEIHHIDEIGDLPKAGQTLQLIDAIKLLTPLCPTCHRMLHAKLGGGSFTVESLREYLRKTST